MGPAVGLKRAGTAEGTHAMSDNVLVFYGSYRATRIGIRMATFVMSELRAHGAAPELIDAREVGLPILDRMYKEYPKHPMLSEMGMVVISSTIAVGAIAETFDADGQPIGEPGRLAQKGFQRVADDLAWWTSAARNQRAIKSPPSSVFDRPSRRFQAPPQAIGC